MVYSLNNPLNGGENGNMVVVYRINKTTISCTITYTQYIIVLHNNTTYTVNFEVQRMGAYTMVYTVGCIAKIYATCCAKNYSKS
jgi:hypothetical protein